MKPYLAIIKDSFREALASYLLWILLILCTLPLLLAAPCSLKEKESVLLTRRDVIDVQGVLEKIVEQGQKAEPSPAKQIWDKLSQEYKGSIADLADSQKKEELDLMQVRNIFALLPRELNRIVADPYFYTKDAFEGVEFGDETRELLAKGPQNLSLEKTKRLNRLLLHDAFPREIAAARKTDYVLKYFKWETKMESFDKGKWLNWIIAKFLSTLFGFFAIWLAIIFTSAFVPRTFEAGSVDLLLSKPAARPLVFLAKYVGGLSFILVCATYTIVGVWLLVGIRLQHWDWRLLISIPIFLFLFAIYYAVSALAGVLWRSAVVSVVIAVAFWVVCFGVEKTEKFVGGYFLSRRAVAEVIRADRSLLVADETGEVRQWFGDTNEWKQVFRNPEYDELGGMVKMIGPVYDSHKNRLLAMYAYDDRLLVGTPENRWAKELDLILPRGVNKILVAPDGTVYAVSIFGIFKEVEQVPDETPAELAEVKGLLPPPATPGGRGFVMASPVIRFLNVVESAMNPVSGDLVLYDQARLIRMTRDENGDYSLAKQIDLPKLGPGILAYADNAVVLALASGKVRVFDNDLQAVKEEELADGEPARRLSVSPDGKRLAVLLHNGELWLFDPAAKTFAKAGVSGQGDICAVNFDRDNLFVVDDYDRVAEYSAGMERLDRFRGKLSGIQKFYYWAVKPLYTIFPKPGEMEDVIQYALTDQETMLVSDDQSRAGAKLNVAQPIWSNLIFIAIVLGLGCFYVHRKDF